jgi:hypothetical protein
MTLPNYFIADLPPDAVLTARLISDACHTLKRNRASYLAGRPTHSLVQLLASVAAAWLDPSYPLRKLALAEGPGALGFSRETIAAGLDAFFRQLTADNLNALLVQDLGHVEALDRPVSAHTGAETGRLALAVGPEFLVHIAAGNIPNPTLTSMVLGLLTRSAQLVKCATGTALLPRLFAHSIYEADAKLGACLEVAEWRGGNPALEGALFAEADCVTATGSNETLAAIRAKLRLQTRVLSYGHRVSFACVAGDALTGGDARRIAAAAAEDVVAWDQLGCLSPLVIYVTEGRGLAADQFAGVLADELAAREQDRPRGQVSTSVAATIASRRAFYAVRAAHSADTRVWQSPESTAWTVIYEAGERFQLSCGHRWVYVKPAKDLAAVLQGADTVRGKVSTVGLAVPEEGAMQWVTDLARWGVTRVCPLGQMQHPPLTWRHDGRPALGELVTWTDWERKRG